MTKRRSVVIGLLAVVGLVSGCFAKGSRVASLDAAAKAGVDGGFWVNTSASVRQHAGAALDGSSDQDLLAAVAAHTVATWLVGGGDPGGQVSKAASAASTAGGTMLLIVYNMPNRDCGQYSAGGTSAGDYGNWIQKIAGAIGSTRTMVVLEPDATALTDCLDEGKKAERFQLLSDAVSKLKQNANTKVYIDAGHPNWKSEGDMADRLHKAGIAAADGFALNSDNYYSDQDNITYGQKLRQLVQKNFIIDTSRNGNGPNGGEWCNPRGRATGKTSTYDTGVSGVDAYVWMHNPGESDGSCNGGPAAGQFWPEIAIEQARNGHLTAATTAADGPAAGSAVSSGTGSSSAPSAVATASPASNASFGSSTGLSATLVAKNQATYTYCVDLAIKNGASGPVATWQVSVDLGSGILSQQWNLKVASQAGTVVTFMPSASYNQQLAAGATSSQQGFCVDLAGSSTKIKPSITAVK